MQNIEIRLLGNGVRLTCITTSQWKTSLMSASFLLPLGGAGRSVAALLPETLRSSCSRYMGRERVAIRLDELYGARLEPFVSKRGEVQMIGVMADVVDECYALGAAESLAQQTAQLVTDILLQPKLPFENTILKNEAASLKSRIAALANNKRTWVVRRMFQHMCQNEDYRLVELGDADALDAVTPESLQAQYEEILRTAPLEIFYCGSLDADRVEEVFRQACSSLPPRPEIVTPSAFVPTAAGELRAVTEEEAVKQGKLAIGFRLGMTAADPLYPAMILANTCYGGSTGSRLFCTVREQKSLCYYASSQLDKLKGVMAVSSGIENENKQQAEDEILRQLRLMQEGDVTAEEVEAARRFALASLRTQGDSPYALESFYRTQAAGGLLLTLDQLANEVQAVSYEQVLEAACRVQPELVYFLKGAAV